jgi:hypothetical protein
MNTYILETMTQAMDRASPEVLALLAEPELELGMGTGDKAGDIPATATMDTKGTQAPVNRIAEQWAAMEQAHNNMVRFTSTWRAGYNAEAYAKAQVARTKAQDRLAFPYLFDASGRQRNLYNRTAKATFRKIQAELALLAHDSCTLTQQES